MKITSPNNQLIKDINRLDRRRNRWKEQKYIAEGFNLVNEALYNKEPIYKIIFSESIKDDKRLVEIIENIDDKDILVELTEELFLSISDTETPQGILAILDFNKNSIDSVYEKENSVFMFLDRIQDPGNLGTIIRTGDAFNIDGIVIGEGTVDPYNPKVVRSTMGSIFRVPIYICNDNIEFFEKIKTSKEKKIVATDLDGERIDKFSLDEGIVVIGNESTGVSDDILNLSDDRIKIDMPGNAESLNAGVAASIIMYEIMKNKD